MAKEISFTINGKQVSTSVDEKSLLVDTIRNEFGLTGTKKACGTGDCGACTVLVNGKTIRSCITLTCMVEGKDVVTIEGIGTEEMPDPIQEAFVNEGAVQCGYCTPGMILTIKAMLAENPNPTREEIKNELAGNICRCTGYQKIYNAVEAVAAKSMDK